MLSWLRIAASRLAALFTGRRMDAEFDDEMRVHVEMLSDDLVRQGFAPAEARRRALIVLGNPAALAQDRRERRGVPILEHVVQDVRFTLRIFARRPAFTLVAVLTMAVGIGVGTTVFSALNAVALRPLPIASARRAVWPERWLESHQRGSRQFLYSYGEYAFLRDHLDALTDLVAVSVPFRVMPASAEQMAVGADAAGVPPFVARLVSDNFFAALGARAQVGRLPSPAEARVPGGDPVIVLSDGCWRSRFHADPGIAGAPVLLNGTRFTIIGVATPDFIGIGNPPEAPDFWASLGLKRAIAPGADWVTSTEIRPLQLLGYVRPSHSVAAAAARAAAIVPALTEQFPAEDKTTAITLERATFFGETNDPRFALFVTLVGLLVGLILVAASANLANMLLARAAGRRREIGVRLALGAGRGRIVRQLLVESVLLSLAGGGIAIVFSSWSSRLLWVRISEVVQGIAGGRGVYVVDLSPDARVVAFTLVVATITGIVFGLAPARQLSRPGVMNAVKDGDPMLGGASGRSRLRPLLVTGQVAVSMTLAVSAGLLARGIVRADGADAGFDTRHVYVIGHASSVNPARAAEIQREVVRRLTLDPNIAGTTLVSMIPFSGTWTRLVQSDVETGAHRSVRSLLDTVSPSFFETIGVAMLRGRTFTSDEAATGAPVAVVSHNAAEALWPGRDPIGERLRLPEGFREPPKILTVVGVAADARTANISRVDPAFVYMPTTAGETYALLVRSPRDTASVTASARAALGAVDPQLLRTLQTGTIEDLYVRGQRTLPDTLSFFARVLAVLSIGLAAAGIYGLVSFLASQRVREIGIRMALGATAADAVRLVLRQGLAPVAGGLTIGLLCSAAVSFVFRALLAAPGTPDFLFGVDAFDPLTFATLTAVVVGTALAASAIPAWRTARIDPLIALRRG